MEQSYYHNLRWNDEENQVSFPHAVEYDNEVECKWASELLNVTERIIGYNIVKTFITLLIKPLVKRPICQNI